MTVSYTLEELAFEEDTKWSSLTEVQRISVLEARLARVAMGYESMDKPAVTACLGLLSKYRANRKPDGDDESTKAPVTKQLDEARVRAQQRDGDRKTH